MSKVSHSGSHDQPANSSAGSGSVLDLVCRQGAQSMLMAAVEAEVAAYIEAFADVRDEDGHRLVVRNGRAEPRQVMTSAGAVNVHTPRVNDRRVDEDTGERKRFASAILPAWARRSPEISEVLPLLYLHGLSSLDFVPALRQFLGSGAGLSASTVTRLTETWQAQAVEFGARDLSGTDYVYVWADGIHVNIRLEEDRLCLLVVVGVRADGHKELVALSDGYRESAGSWADLLRDCKRRGMRAPVLAVGDGALGFWGALREVFPDTREQRCWFHGERNELTMACCGAYDGLGVGQSLPGGCRRVALLGENDADLTDDVADGSPADGEQLSECVLAA